MLAIYIHVEQTKITSTFGSNVSTRFIFLLDNFNLEHL